jgi:hypothetical protein
MSQLNRNTRGWQGRKQHQRPPDDAWIITRRTDDKMLGPDLPAIDGVTWHKLTRAWYRDIRKSDVAQIYTDSEWHSLLDAALLKNAIASGIGRNGKPLGHRDFQGYQTELRQKESALLLSPESRKRLRVVFVDPENATPETVAKSPAKPNYRDLFSDESAEQAEPELPAETVEPDPMLEVPMSVEEYEGLLNEKQKALINSSVSSQKSDDKQLQAVQFSKLH